MYYKSNNTVTYQPILWDIDSDKIKKSVFYYMEGFLEKLHNSSMMISHGIKTNAIGYNREKYNNWENVYLMVYSNINSLAKNYIVANTALDDISKLEENWNDNGANAFPIELVEKCREIVNQLVAEPFVCPTACGSIQFEYEKENGEYLEFEVYEDRIEVYMDSILNGEEEFNLCGITAVDKMKQMVVDFYA